MPQQVPPETILPSGMRQETKIIPMKSKEKLRSAFYQSTGSKPYVNKGLYVSWLEDQLLRHIEPGVSNNVKGTLDLIASAVAQAWGVPVHYLYNVSNKPAYSHPRKVAIELSQRYVRVNSLTPVKHFGLRSHSSYYAAIKFVQNSLAIYADFRNRYNKATQIINELLTDVQTSQNQAI